MKTFNRIEDKTAAVAKLEKVYNEAMATLKACTNTKSEEYETLFDAMRIANKAVWDMKGAKVVDKETGFDLTTKKNSIALATQNAPVPASVIKNHKLYVNISIGSDCQAYEVIGVTPSGKTLTIRSLDTELQTKMEMVVGGFSAHTTNNHAQEYIYTSNENNPIRKIRVGKHGLSSQIGRAWLAIKPNYFYDFNF